MIRGEIMSNYFRKFVDVYDEILTEEINQTNNQLNQQKQTNVQKVNQQKVDKEKRDKEILRKKNQMEIEQQRKENLNILKKYGVRLDPNKEKDPEYVQNLLNSFLNIS